MSFIYEINIFAGNNEATKILLHKIFTNNIKDDHDVTDSFQYSLLNFNYLLASFKTKIQNRIFDFSYGIESGFEINEFTIPNEGYGFISWIRIEGSTTPKLPYCIWHFCSKTKYNIELDVSNGSLVYVIDEGFMSKCNIIINDSTWDEI